MILLALVTVSYHNCTPIKKYIQNHHIDADKIVIMDKTHEAFRRNCDYWGVTQTPTVLLIDKGKEIGRAYDTKGLKQLLK